MKSLSILLVFSILSVSHAEEKIKMYYNNEDVTKIIETYSKASKQKFVLDPTVRGKVSIFQQDPITLEEAYNQLSTALATNGYAISKQGDTYVVKSARNIQRDYIEVSSEKPNLKPERMYSWVYTAKNVPATSINRNLRILVSKDGEMAVNENTNQIVFTDWTTNLNRIASLLNELDKPVDPAIAKLVEQSKSERFERKNKSKKQNSEENNEPSEKTNK